MEKLGKYKIVEELGKGAMGVVYKAQDPDIDREVAIKTIRFDAISEAVEKDELMKRFIKEAQAAGKLAHPNIITIYDVGKEKDLTYIVMQYVEGQSLKELIESGKEFTPYEIIDIIIQICDALDYAHSKGIVHRDMKPGNILLDKTGKPFIVDFGVARVETSTMTQTGQTLGTPSYMSPEQVMGEKVDGRSDIFSVGVILYELLTGKRPFSAEGGITTLIYRIVNEPPIPLSKVKKNVSAKFEPIVEKALAKEVDKRYQTCSELANALRPLKGVPEKTLTLKISKDELLGAEERKKPRLVLILGATLGALIILGGGAGYFFFVKGGKIFSPQAKVQQAKLEEKQTETKTPGKVTTGKSEKPAQKKAAVQKEVKSGTKIPVSKPVSEPKTTTQEKLKTAKTTPPVIKGKEEKKEAEVGKAEPEIKKKPVEKPATSVGKSEEKKEEAPKVITPDPIAGLVRIMKENYVMENYKEVKRVAEEILNQDPANAMARDYRSRAEKKIEVSRKIEAGIRSYEKNDFSQTVKIMEEVLQLDSANKQAQQYLKLAKEAMEKFDESFMRQIVERQKKAEEESDFELLLSDYSEEVKKQRLEEVRDIFKYYTDITSHVEKIQVTPLDSTHARVSFIHVILGTYIKSGQKREIFSGTTVLTLERQGDKWIIIDYRNQK